LVPLALGPSLFRSQHVGELGQQVAFFLPNQHGDFFCLSTPSICTHSPRGQLHLTTWRTAPVLGVAAAHHAMRASAQVTAPGAITSMIVAVSTRPNRQKRSTCSRMSAPLVQNRMLSPVDRFGQRSRRSQIAASPHQDREDHHRHPEDKYEPASFGFDLGAMCPSWLLLVLVPVHRGRCELLHTSLLVQKMMGVVGG
jgi:hypothetical protein